MTRNDDGREPDNELGSLLRNALRDEAGTVSPSSDGLARIRRRLAGRRGQQWRRPAMVLGAAATVAVVAIGAVFVVTGHDGGGSDTLQIQQNPRTPVTSAPTSQPVTNSEFPSYAIFPFTTASAEQAWEGQYANGHSPWQSDPTAVAQAWVTNYLDQPAIDRVISTSSTGGRATVTLGRVVTGQPNPSAVTVVHLTQFDHAWLVTGASDPDQALSLSGPAPGAAVSSPLTVTGPGYGADQAVEVQVREAASTNLLGHASTGSFGAGTPLWNASVSFGGSAHGVGVVVAVAASAADGGPQRLVARQVTFAGATPPATPTSFYGIANGRITQFAAADGKVVGYLTDAQPGVELSDPQLVGTTAYYLQQTARGACGNALMSVATTGAHAVQHVVDSDAGYSITGYAEGNGLAYAETGCGGERSPQGKLIVIDSTGQHVTSFASLPPVITGDPSFEPPASTAYLDAFVRTGTQGYLARYDADTAHTDLPRRNACPGFDITAGLPQAIEVDTNGILWAAVATGSGMQVVRCPVGGDQATVAFTVTGNHQPADVDVTSDGSAVLLTDTADQVWRWDGSGAPTRLSPPVPLDHVTW